MTRNELIEAATEAVSWLSLEASSEEVATAIVDALVPLIRADTAARISDAISDAFGRDERALDCADLAAQMFPVQVQS